MSKNKILELIKTGVTEKHEMAEKAGMTKAQVKSAIHNLRYDGKIELVHRRSAGRHKGQQQAIYRVVEPRSAAVPSVFHLGYCMENH